MNRDTRTDQAADDLRRALHALRASAAKEYYNPEADAANRESYYAGFSQPPDKGDFFRELSGLINKTHTNHLNYSPKQYLYPVVDHQPNNKLRSIYTGDEYDPEKIIREDFRIEAEWWQLFRQRILSAPSPLAESLEGWLDFLEKLVPYNCEHSVPASWFGHDLPMFGDLHHLFTCEMKCNTSRGNHAYYDFDDYPTEAPPNCGKQEGENRFEPYQGKGAVARATLYFLIRYPGEVNHHEKKMDGERLATLIRWHQEEEVTLYERHRNAEVFELQGNRNPLIDFPEWVVRMDLNLGLGAEEQAES